MNEKKPISEIIKESFTIFSANKLKLLLLTLFSFLPVQIVLNLVDWKMNSDEKIVAYSEQIEKLAEESESSLGAFNALVSSTQDISARLLPYYVIIAILSILSFVFTIGVAKLVFDESKFLDYKENATAFDYMNFGVKSLPKFLLTYICFIVFALIGFISFFVPGVIILFGMLSIVATLTYSGLYGVKAVWSSVKTLFKKPGISFCFIICEFISLIFSSTVMSILDLFTMPELLSTILSAIIYTAVTYFLLTIKIIPYLYYLNRINN